MKGARFFLISLALGALYFYAELKRDFLISFSGPVRLEGRVVSFFVSGRKHLVEAGGCRWLVFFKTDPELFYGDNLKLIGVAFLPYEFKNPGSFRSRLFLKRQRICGLVKAKRVKVLKRGSGLLNALHRLRRKLLKAALRVDEPARSAFLGMILGEKSAVKPEYKRLFYTSGLGHLLAVSGFHFGIALSTTFLIFLFFLRAINLVVPLPFYLLPSRAAHVLNLLILPVLLVLTGLQISAQRAAVMYAVFAVSRILERKISLKTVAALSFVLLFVKNPLDITSAGFQMTFLAVFAIAVLAERVKAPVLLRYVLVSLVLPAILFPVSGFHFKRIYPLSPVSNVLLLPAFSLLIPAMMLSAIFLPVTDLGFYAVNIILKPVLSVMRVFSSLSFSTLWVTRSEFFALLGLSFAILGWILREKKLFVLSMVLFLASTYSHFSLAKDRAVFFDMGKRGRATLVVYKKRKFLVSPKSRLKRARQALLSALLWQDAKKLDGVVLMENSRAEKEIVSFLRNRIEIGNQTFDFEVLDRSPRCTGFRLEGLCFCCSDCPCQVCMKRSGLVIIRGEEVKPWKTGAVEAEGRLWRGF